MTASRELIEAVRARTEGTPYVLVETEDGFDLGVDVADVTYYSLMYQRSLKKTYSHEVRLEADTKTIAITDTSREVTWKRGLDVDGAVPRPSFGARMSVARGRLQVVSFQKSWAVTEEGRVGKVVDYTFSSSESRDLIRVPARELGWHEVRGTAEKVGLYVAVTTVALLALSGIVLALLFLLGVR